MAGFQPSSPLSLSGHIHPTILHEPGGTPAEIIEAGSNFLVHVEWAITGSAVALMGGNFQVKVYFEGFGNDTDEKQFASGDVAVVPVSGYHYTVHIPVNGTDLKVGAYRMIALVTYKNAAGNPGPIAGYSDDVIVQIFP
ncbi:MAG: hypothetical protein U0Y68_00280 [Blastocatellia bacterium]